MLNVIRVQSWFPSGPVGTTPAEVAALGVALGKEAAAAFVAYKPGTMAHGRLPYCGIESDAGEEVADLLDVISARVGDEAAGLLVNTLRAGMNAELAKRLASSAEADADEAATQHAQE